MKTPLTAIGIHTGPLPRRTVFWALALVLAVAWVYAQAATFDGISLDDPQYVFENPHVTGSFGGKSLIWALTANVKGYWGPVTWLSLMLDHRLWGGWAGGYHLANVLFHCANALLVFWVWFRQGIGALPAMAMASLFALHPVHVESVCWITERKDVLFLFFGLLTLLAWVRWIERPTRLRYAVVLGCFGLGLGAKSMLVTLPVLMLLLDHWPLGRLEKKGLWACMGEKWPLFLMAAMSGGMTLVWNFLGGPMDALAVLPLKVRLAHVPVSYAIYLKLLIWPAGIAFYPHHPASIRVAATVGALAMLVAVTVLVVRLGRQRPWLPVGWFWFLLGLLPVIGLIQLAGQAWGARFLYLPALGIYLMIAGNLRGRSIGRPVSILLCLLVAVPLMILSRQQAGYWQDGQTLYSRTTALNPDNYWAWGALAETHQREGRFFDAYRYYQKALAIHPNYIPALTQIAVMAVVEGNQTPDLQLKIALYRKAAKIFEQVDTLHPGLVDGWLDAIDGFFHPVAPVAAKNKPPGRSNGDHRHAGGVFFRIAAEPLHQQQGLTLLGHAQ